MKYYRSLPVALLLFVPHLMTSSEEREVILQLEDGGDIPKLDRSSDLEGPDTNANGIRDDIEEFIIKNYPSALQQTAVRQFAHVMQEAILVDKTNKAAVKAIAEKSSRAINCIYTRFNDDSGSNTPPAMVIEQVESISTNTKPRLLAYLAYAKALDGTAGMLPESNTCE